MSEFEDLIRQREAALETAWIMHNDLVALRTAIEEVCSENVGGMKLRDRILNRKLEVDSFRARNMYSRSQQAHAEMARKIVDAVASDTLKLRKMRGGRR